MIAAGILREAIKTVSQDREAQYGPADINFSNIASLWTAYLDIRRDPVASFSSEDVANMMVLLKIARTQVGSPEPDTHVDMAGYAAIGGELARPPAHSVVELTPTDMAEMRRAK